MPCDSREESPEQKQSKLGERRGTSSLSGQGSVRFAKRTTCTSASTAHRVIALNQYDQRTYLERSHERREAGRQSGMDSSGKKLRGRVLPLSALQGTQTVAEVQIQSNTAQLTSPRLAASASQTECQGTFAQTERRPVRTLNSLSQDG